MKKYLKPCLELISVMGLIVLFVDYNIIALARELLPISAETYNEFDAALPAPPKGETGQTTAKQMVIAGLGYVKTVSAVVGVLYITLQGYSMVSNGDEEEEVAKARRGIVYILIAFVIISMSQDLARIFDFEESNVLSSPQEILKRARIFDKQVEIAITFIKYMIGAYATFMLVVSGFKMVTEGGNEEDTTKHKKSILYSISGLLILLASEIGINKVFYKVNKDVYSGIKGVTPGIDPAAGVEEIVGATNLIVSFTAPIAVLMLIVGAIMYATAGGEEENMEKAKRVIFMTVLGIIIIYGAFAIVSTVISGRLDEVGALMQ